MNLIILLFLTTTLCLSKGSQALAPPLPLNPSVTMESILDRIQDFLKKDPYELWLLSQLFSIEEINEKDFMKEFTNELTEKRGKNGEDFLRLLHQTNFQSGGSIEAEANLIKGLLIKAGVSSRVALSVRKIYVRDLNTKVQQQKDSSSEPQTPQPTPWYSVRLEGISFQFRYYPVPLPPQTTRYRLEVIPSGRDIPLRDRLALDWVYEHVWAAGRGWPTGRPSAAIDNRFEVFPSGWIYYPAFNGPFLETETPGSRIPPIWSSHQAPLIPRVIANRKEKVAKQRYIMALRQWLILPEGFYDWQSLDRIVSTIEFVIRHGRLETENRVEFYRWFELPSDFIEANRFVSLVHQIKHIIEGNIHRASYLDSTELPWWFQLPEGFSNWRLLGHQIREILDMDDDDDLSSMETMTRANLGQGASSLTIKKARMRLYKLIKLIVAERKRVERERNPQEIGRWVKWEGWLLDSSSEKHRLIHESL